MKRFTSLALCLVIAAAMLPGITVRAATSDFSTVEEVLYEIELFSPDSIDNLDGGITRAVLAKVAVSISPQRVAVPAKSNTSPFKDVKYDHWAAPYIKLAVQAGYMSAYSDGTFRPDETVKLEDGVTAILKALGYTSSDYGTDYPYGPMSFAAGKDYDLLNGISSGTGSMLTRKTLMRLVYNALDCNLKGDGMTTATLLADLGYTRVNPDDPIDLDSVDPDELTGPVTLKSGNWVSKLEIKTSDYSVYRNDVLSSKESLADYDVLYYSKRQNAMYAYSSSLIGVLQEVSPARQNPESVTVGGVSYTLEGTQAKDSVNLTGEIRVNDIVMLLFGMDNLVADIIKLDEASATQYGFVMEAGRKEFTLETGGSTIQSYYVSIATIYGNTVEYRCKDDASELIDKMVRVTFSEGTAVVSAAESQALQGKIDASALTVGTKKLAPGIKIMEVESGYARIIPLSRLDGVNVNYLRGKFYTTNSNGEIDTLYFRASTGDTLTYGIITDIIVVKGEYTNTSTISYNIAGDEGSFIMNKIADYPLTPALLKPDYEAVGGVPAFAEAEPLTRISNVTVELNQVRDANGSAYLLSDDADIYVKTGTLTYEVISRDQAVALGGDYVLSAYFDKPMDQCGRVRVVIADKP